MADWTADPWVKAHAVMIPEKLHALGVITATWNTCEYWAHAMFSAVLRRSEHTARIITHDLGDITIWTKIIDLARQSDLPEETKEAIAYASQVYERCRTNRNQFVHASLVGSQNPVEGPLELARMKGPTILTMRIDGSLADIRRVADEISSLVRYCAELTLHVDTALDTNSDTLPLPNKPPVPKSIWSPPQTTQAKQKRQPPTSQA